MKKLFFGGIHPKYNTEMSTQITDFRTICPMSVAIPMQQHIGAPCTPLVQVGDRVLRGQKIGDGEGLCVPVHSSVSGLELLGGYVLPYFRQKFFFVELGVVEAVRVERRSRGFPILLFSVKKYRVGILHIAALGSAHGKFTAVIGEGQSSVKAKQNSLAAGTRQYGGYNITLLEFSVFHFLGSIFARLDIFLKTNCLGGK